MKRRRTLSSLHLSLDLQLSVECRSPDDDVLEWWNRLLNWKLPRSRDRWEIPIELLAYSIINVTIKLMRFWDIIYNPLKIIMVDCFNNVSALLYYLYFSDFLRPTRDTWIPYTRYLDTLYYVQVGKLEDKGTHTQDWEGFCVSGSPWSPRDLRIKVPQNGKVSWVHRNYTKYYMINWCRNPFFIPEGNIKGITNK